MNTQHLKIIADHFQFKLSKNPAQQIPSGPGGGHICWKVESEEKILFIKQLDPIINLNEQKILLDMNYANQWHFSLHNWGFLLYMQLRIMVVKQLI